MIKPPPSIPSQAVGICENCRHAKAAPINPMDLKPVRPLNCHRYPPTVQLINAGGGIGTANVLPTVEPGGSCGEWSAAVLIS